MFAKLEKESSGPTTLPSFKTGTTFGTKIGDVEVTKRPKEPRSLGDPTSFSASATQTRKTTNMINSMNNQPVNGSEPILNHSSSSLNTPSFSNNVKNADISDKANGTNGISSSVPHSNGSSSNPPDDLYSDVFIEPKSEPARHIFNRKLSAEVLPRPYQAPSKVEIKSVRRPSSSSSQSDIRDTGRSAPVAAVRSPIKSTAPLEKSLSKDDIAASLAAADKYLNKINSESTINELSSTEESMPWRSSFQQAGPEYVNVQEVTDEVKATPIDNVAMAVEGAHSAHSNEDNLGSMSNDGSVPYDNVADVLAELKASGHTGFQQPNTQLPIVSNGNSFDQSYDSRSHKLVNEESVTSPYDTAEPYQEPYDSVASSTQSVYLESKVLHTYNNIHDFLGNKKRLESTSDDEPYEPISPPTPPSRHHPANLPPCDEVEPEPMSTEEAQQLLSLK